MKCANLLLLILLVAAAVTVACGGDATQTPPAPSPSATLASPGTPAQTVTPPATATPITASQLSPEDSVRALIDAMAAVYSEKMASLAPPEGRE